MKISVYITSYNQKEFLKEAIESVLNQTLLPYEIIVVDDASTDGSQELIKNYSENHKIIKYIFHDRNAGVSQTRITALSNVSGDYVTYVDGDDILLPDKLRIESDLIRETGCNLAFSNNVYVSENDIDDEKWVWMNNDLVINEDTNLFVKTLTRDYPRSSMFRMELIELDLLKKVGFHDPKLEIYEDYDLRIRLSKVARIAFSPQVTSKIRISTEGLSKSNNLVHKRSLRYIFSKYQSDIALLDSELKNHVEIKLDEILKSFDSKKPLKKTKEFFIRKLKKKLKNLAKKLS